jgi:hypothetical protein
VIPETVKIGAVEYAVKVVAEIDGDDADGEDVHGARVAYGEVHHTDSTIVLLDGRPLDALRQTLWHEIIHVAQFYASVQQVESAANVYADLMCRLPSLNWRDGPLPASIDLWGVNVTIKGRRNPNRYVHSKPFDYAPREGILCVRDSAPRRMMHNLLKGLFIAADRMMCLDGPDAEVYRLAAYVYQVLIDNPALWEGQIPAERPSAKRRRHKPDAPKAA